MVYKYEMHQHTFPCSLCAKGDPALTVSVLREEGFAGCVFTEHFYHGNTGIDRNLPWKEFYRAYEKSYLAAKREGEKLDFDVLFGIEEHVGKGKEVLIYGITPKFIYDNPCLRNCTLEKLHYLVHEAGGLLIQAHPFRNRPYIQDPDQPLDARFLDGYEIWNSSNSVEDNLKAIEYTREKLPFSPQAQMRTGSL